MRKRLLSLFVAVAMILGMIPSITMVAYADDGEGAPGISLGTAVLGTGVNTADAQTVYFGPDGEKARAWRVIGFNGEGVASKTGDATLLCANGIGKVQYFNGERPFSNEYATSSLREKIEEYTSALTDGERAAIKKRSLDGIAGSSVDDAVLWPLSGTEAGAVQDDLRKLSMYNPDWAESYWWLRSPGENHDSSGYEDSEMVGVVSASGGIHSAPAVFSEGRNTRPAFNLNLGTVMFTSAATSNDNKEDMKTANEVGSSLNAVTATQTAEWKLTVKYGHDSFNAEATSNTNNTLTIYYLGAVTGTNEYISAIIEGSDSSIKYYGRLKAADSTGGSVEINLPETAEGDKLYVFNEQCNGYQKTDYCSTLVEIHMHDFNFSADAATITAACTEGCYLNGKKVDLTIISPEKKTDSDSKAANATLEGADAFNSATGKSISANDIEYYSGTQKLASAPSAAGFYKAQITVEGVTASVDYTIAADPTPTPTPTPDPSSEDSDVDKVVKMINDLPAADQIQLTDEAAVKAAREAFNKLSDEQKKDSKLTTDLVKKLEDCEAQIEEAKKSADAQKAAGEVIEKINALPDDPTKANSQDVADAVEAYKALSDTAKQLVTEGELNKLQAAMDYPASAKKATIKSAKAQKGKKALVKWKKASGVNGYQLYYKAKGVKAKTVTITKAGTLKKTVKKLKAGKKYSFKIRTYKKVENLSTGNMKKVYGKWSKVKKAKAKK